MTTKPGPLVAANFPRWLELGPWVSQDGTLDTGDLPLLKANGLRWQPHDFPRHSVAVINLQPQTLEVPHECKSETMLLRHSGVSSTPLSCLRARADLPAAETLDLGVPAGHSSGSHPLLPSSIDYRCQAGLLGGAGLESAPSGSLGRAAAAVAPRRQCPQDWPGSQLAVRSDPVVGLGCILMPSGRHQGAQRSSQLLTAPNMGGRCILLFYLGSQQPSLMPHLRSGSRERGPARVGQRTHGGVARGSCPTNSWRCISAVHPVHHRAVAGQLQRHLPTSWSPSSALRPLS